MAPDVPKGWAEHTLSELGSFRKGRGGSRQDDRPEGVPVIRYGELYTEHHDVIRTFNSFIDEGRVSDYTRLKHGDLVLAASGETAEEIGKSAVYLGRGPAYTSGDTIVFGPNGLLEPEFLGYASNGPAATRFKASVGQGASVVHIYERDLKQMPVLVPPLSEQRKIAGVLSSVDDAIAGTRKVIEQTERAKQGLLQTLMTRGIGHTHFKQSDIGEIPEEWEVLRLGEVFSERKESGRPGLPTKSVTIEGGILVDRDSLDRRVESELPAEKHALVEEGDIAYNTMRMWQGACGLALEDCIVSPAYVVVRPSDRIVPEFARFWFRSPVMLRRLYSYSQGVTSDRWRLYFDSFSAIPAAVPAVNEQEQIARRLKDLESSIQGHDRLLFQLKRLKRGLLQDLLTGRVRVTPD